MSRIFIISFMVFCWAGVVVAQEVDQFSSDSSPLSDYNQSIAGQSFDPDSVLKQSLAAQSIDEITGTVRLLGDEEFRPKGKSLTLSLNEAIMIAMEQNPNIRISKSQVLSSAYNLELVQSDFRTMLDVGALAQERFRRVTGGGFRIDPDQGLISESTTERENGELFRVGPVLSRNFYNGSSVTLSPSIEWEHRSDAQFDSFNGRGSNEEDRYSIGVDFNIPLNSRPREEIRTRVDNAKLNTIQSDQSLTVQKSLIKQLVMNQYWNLKQLEEQIDIQNERILQSRRVEFIIQTQYEFENASQVQVGQAQIDVLNNEANMIELEGRLRSSQENFNLLLGTPIETNLNLTDELTIDPLPLNSSAYVEMVTSSNLTLQNTRLSIEQTQNSLKVARLGQQPNLTFSTSYNRNDEGAEDIVGAFIFNWPFIDGGATKARVRVLEEQLKRQEIDLWNQERELVQETYQDLRELQLQQQRIEILRQNVDQAYVNLENDLFIFTETGRISFRDMQDSQIELAQSRLTLTNAIVSYNLAQNRLMQKIHDYNPSEIVEPILGLLNPDKTSSNGLF